MIRCSFQLCEARTGCPTLCISRHQVSGSKKLCGGNACQQAVVRMCHSPVSRMMLPFSLRGLQVQPKGCKAGMEEDEQNAKPFQ